MTDVSLETYKHKYTSKTLIIKTVRILVECKNEHPLLAYLRIVKYRSG